MRSEIGHTPARQWTRFRHPLLRIAAQCGDTPKAFRDFHLMLRRSLDEQLPEHQRIASARSVLRHLPHLGLGEGPTSEFLLEWLEVATTGLHEPGLQHALALASLSANGVKLSPSRWADSSKGDDEFSPPYLDAIGAGTQRLMAHRTGTAYKAWQDGLQMVQQSVDEGLHHHWDGEQCCTGVRLIALCSSIRPAEGPMEPAVARLNYLAGIGMGLWEALRSRMRDLDESAIVCPELWDGSVQKTLLLHLRGQARTDQLNGSTGDTAGVGVCGSERMSATAGETVLQVITSAIPRGSNLEDRDVLRSYEVLREPQPVHLLPDYRQLEVVFEQLAREYPWAPEAVSSIRQSLVTRSLFGVRELALDPVLLIGPPGGGKSRLARRLAELLQVPYLPFALGGAHDSKVLTGTSRGWSGGEPASILKFLMNRRTASAMVLLDELDKVSTVNSDAAPLSSVLLGMLEQETAAR